MAASASLRQRWRARLTSVRLRLTLWSLILLAAVLVAFSLFVYFSQQRTVQASTSAELQDLSVQLTGYFKENHDRLVQSGTAGVADAMAHSPAKPGGKLVVALLNAQGHVTQMSTNLAPGDAATLEKVWFTGSVNAKNSQVELSLQLGNPGADQAYEVLVTQTPFREFDVAAIAVGLPQDPSGQLKGLNWTLVTGSLALLLADLLIGYWLAGRILRPVQAITRAAREIGETDLHRRLALGRADELGELADTFDQMLARLEAAFERQRQFTADASHELRTPLTILELETERALAQLRAPEEYQRALAVIQTESSAMARLVSDLLTLARLEPGASPGQRETLDLSEVTLDVIERLAPLAHSQGARLVIGELPELPVLGDSQQLAQMLSNLIENALQHGQARDASPEVRIEAGRRQAADQPMAWVRVTDNGPGIAPEHLPRVFDRFYRADAARDAGGGHGLGLAIVRQIALAHGGSVTASSSGVAGEGACFEVTLPLSVDRL